MKKMNIFIALIYFALCLSGCDKPTAGLQKANEIHYYTEIPGITEDEINAIEDLKSSRSSFSYGAIISSELFIESDGSRAGFAVGLCALLSDLFGTPFEALLYYDRGALKAEYDNKEIDFIGELCPTPERMEVHLMSNPIAEHALRVFTRTDMPELRKETELNGRKIGFLSDVVTSSYILKAYPELSFDIVELENYQEAAERLIAGEIDAFIEDADADPFFLDYAEIKSKTMFSMVYSPISISSANRDLAPFFSVLNKYLTAGGVDTLLDLYDEGELSYAKYKLRRTLTDEERAFIHAAKENPVKLLLVGDSYPISFYNKSEGEYQGIAVDILREMYTISEIPFEIVSDGEMAWSELYETLRRGEAAMMSQLFYSEEREESFLWSEAPYASSFYALLSRADYQNLSNHQVSRTKVGNIQGTVFEKVFYDWFPEYGESKRYDNQIDGAAALMKGEIDLLMASEYTLLSQSNYYENSGLKVNILLNTTMESFFGFHKDQAALRSVINKLQSYINVEAIERSWVSRSYDYQKKAAMERMDYFMAFTFILLLVLILTVFLFAKNKRLSSNLSALVKERTAELENQKTTLTAMYETIPDIIYSTDLDLTYTSVNPSFEKIAGKEQKDIIGKRAFEVFADQDMSAMFTKGNAEALESKELKIIEESIRYPDGRIAVVETIKAPLFQNGRLTGLLGIARNITERIKADEHAKLMLEATPLCCSLFDSEYRIIDCNEEALKLYGTKSKSEYLGKFYELSPEFQPDGQRSIEAVHTYINEAFEKGKVVFEWLHKRMDGTLIPCEITVVRVLRHNEPVLAAYARDLSEHNKMHLEIEHKDRLLQAVNNAASVLLQSDMEDFEQNLLYCMGMMAEAVKVDRVYIWENTVQDGHLYASQTYEWSEGAEPQQGNDFTQSVSYDDVAPGWEETLSHGECINTLAKDAHPVTRDRLSEQGILSILVVPVFIRDTFWGFVGFDDCHRERLFSEDEITVLRSGGIMIASALLRNEMNKDIREAVAAAKEASRAKSNFLSNMSHEIRTPLNAITGMTMIGKWAGDARKKDYALGKIEEASNHLLGVVNDILDMSKIEANKFTLSNVSFDFEKMLQKVVNVVNFRIYEKKQNFTAFIADNMPYALVGDSQRLAQVITNLLTNAVKFTPEEASIRLDANLLGEEDGLCTIQIDVTDAGIGIDPSRQESVFSPFEQAENDTSRKYGGTGLGLAISKYIVELMGGEIWLSSKPGEGSKFSFTVKMKRAGEEKKPALPRIHDHIRILAVDDDRATREYFSSIAGRLSIPCATAAGGREALQLVDGGERFNMFFVDWNMPEMDGITLTKEIKRRSKGNSVVIMISSFDWSSIETEAREAGVDQFIPKPLFPSLITECINERFGKRDESYAEGNPMEDVSLHGRRILLAEDVQINREIIQTLLEPTGAEIDCAENGIEAVEMFRKNPERYSLILMDVQMPKMDGLEATRCIRALDASGAAEVPIVAMTANVFREDIEHCKEAGMNAHLGKPLDVDELIAVLNKYVLGR